MTDIVTDLRDGIQMIQLNRADKKNALTSAMYVAIAETLRNTALNPAARVALIHGAGDAFSAGNDLNDFLHHPPGAGDSPQKQLIDALADFDKPLVAAVRGAAIGSGSTMLTYCDFVYAGEGSRFQYPFINLAVVPEFGTSYALPTQVGYLRAAEIVFLGKPFGAAQALAMGLVTQVVPDADVLAVAQGTAHELAKKPPAALRACKQLMRRPGRAALQRAVKDELVEFSEKVQSADAREAITAFLEKRAPVFGGAAAPVGS